MTHYARGSLPFRSSFSVMRRCSNSQCSMPLAMRLVSAAIPSSVNIAPLMKILAMYNAASAFCEGLHGEIPQRTTETDRQYRVAGHEKSTPLRNLKGSSLRTQQAREWWDMCTGSKLFPALTLARKWKTAMSHDTQWQTVHVSEQVLDGWRILARESGVKVSDFDLFASWIQLVGVSRSPVTASVQAHPLTSSNRTLQNSLTPSTQMFPSGWRSQSA